MDAKRHAEEPAPSPSSCHCPACGALLVVGKALRWEQGGVLYLHCANCGRRWLKALTDAKTTSDQPLVLLSPDAASEAVCLGLFADTPVPVPPRTTP
jgi:hypothetical protein